MSATKSTKSSVVITLVITTLLGISTASANNGGGTPTPTPTTTNVTNNNPVANANADAYAKANADAAATANANANQQQSQSLQNQNSANANNINTVNTGDQNVKVNTGDQNVHTNVDNDIVNMNKIHIEGPTANGGAGGQGGAGGKGGEGGEAKSSSNSSVGNVSADGGEANSTSSVGNVSASGGNVSDSGNSSATGIAGDVTVDGSQASASVGNVQTGDNKISIDDHSKSKNVNVTLVPPSMPSLSSAPLIQECANCFVDYMFSILEACGATTQAADVIKGDDLDVADDVLVTMTTLGNFPGIRKKRAPVAIVSVVANKVPAEGSYECIAMVTVQAKGKNGHLLTPDELRIRATQAGQYLAVDGNEPLYLVLSRKATIEHATLVTTGSGWSVAPGAGGPLGNAIGSIIGNLGNSRGSATNDWTPELTGVIIRPKAGTGVTSRALSATENAPPSAASVSENP